MKGEAGLARSQFVCQIADALLAFSQPFDQSQPGFVAERAEEAERLLDVAGGLGRHDGTIRHVVAPSQDRPRRLAIAACCRDVTNVRPSLRTRSKRWPWPAAGPGPSVACHRPPLRDRSSGGRPPTPRRPDP